MTFDELVSQSWSWSWYTSNSYYRLGIDGSYEVIMSPYKCSSDGHPNIYFKNEPVKSLIVAAPDLYKVLEAMVNMHIEDLGCDGLDNPVIDQAYAALAIAKGE